MSTPTIAGSVPHRGRRPATSSRTGTRLRDLREALVPAVRIESFETLARTARRLREHGRDAALITDGDQVIGIFTTADLVRACAAGVDTHGAVVRTWMSTPVMVAADHLTVHEALALMHDAGVRHLPVDVPGRGTCVLAHDALAAVDHAVRAPG